MVDVIAVNFISGSVTQSGISTFDGVVAAVDAVVELSVCDCLMGGGLMVL